MEKALVVGFGVSGKGATELLLRQGVEVSVYSDGEIDLSDYPQVKDASKSSEYEAVADKDFVVISPSVENTHKIVEYANRFSVPVIGEIELGYRYCKGGIIAITGTNGKTTTTKLINEIINAGNIKSYALGNIGEAFCARADKIEQDEIAVLEVSSFQLESIKQFRPRIAACLNVTPDHMERHKTIENYAMAKFNIFINQGMGDCAILNYDDKIVKDFCDDVCGEVFFTSANTEVKGAYLSNGNIVVNIDKKYDFMSVEDIPLKGEYNYQNVMTAILASKLLGIDDKYIKKAIAEFRLPRYRNEYIGCVNGIDVFNDSKATNIDSAIKACNSMQGDTSLIVGGYDKGIAYDGFFAKLPENIKHIIATGDNVYSIMQFLPSYHEYTFEITSSLERATELAMQKPVKNVLFSPTTSSFDRYSSYVERGEHFDMIIANMKN
ncbi:MAG: UDP-N-acetylmuramoyl-L-alanine--D-glutamate ligase [Clostridiales bacterium]|nr:UDP-N-acetylmuramoyl-L-alanine--D-glutamate ligase [Clostridiales bacterium]